MHQIAPELCSLEGLKETNMERRAEAVIEAASKLECDQFVSKTEILQVTFYPSLCKKGNLYSPYLFHYLIG